MPGRIPGDELRGEEAGAKVEEGARQVIAGLPSPRAGSNEQQL